MRNLIYRHVAHAVMALLIAFPVLAQAFSPNPDLTAAGAIATLKTDTNSSPLYGETYNLGATGLRGWIYIGGGNGADGTITVASRQILVTVASTPGSAVLAVDDVILGAMAGSSGTVPLFTSDCRKAFGVAIGDAEKTGAGALRVKRWRAGTTTDVNIAMTIMGDYTATAPYSCPKSSLILANARIKLVSQLIADPNFLTNSYGGAIKGLALLAGVAPGDANYATVQTRLQTYARSLAPANLTLTGCDTWNWSYIGMFLSEYYLRTVADGTPDASVLHGLNEYTVALAKSQSRYGTFGHGGSLLKNDGSLHGTIPPYGPVNSAGLPANVAIVLGKKAILASGGTLDPEIDPAIQRGSDFFGYYVDKGGIPYGEHEPVDTAHASNGKDSMCAVLFGLQDTRPVETEFFTRMTVAGCTGREYGHTGQGFSYLWGAMGANMGGPTAVAKYLENVRWHLDLSRRTDGSFAYDGAEQYGGSRTTDGTYLGASGYYDVSPTASYILSFAVSLQRLYITGRNAIPANTLSAPKVTNAMAAATFKQDCTAYTVPQLMTALSEYDPVVRNYVAVELAARTLTTEVNDLIALITNGTMSTDANVRQAACQTLGIRQTAGALTALGQRLSDTDVWVRAKAAKALTSIGSAASPQLTPMLTAVTANATNPDIIDWSDPIQLTNGFLAEALFDSGLASSTLAAAKNLLYPAVKVGLKQPDSHARSYLNGFIQNSLTLADVEALIPDLMEVVTSLPQADVMWHGGPRAAGIATLAKYNISEGIPLALGLQVVPAGWGHSSDVFVNGGLNALKTYGDAARWTLPTLNSYLLIWDPASATYANLVSTVATIDGAITAPPLVPGLPVAYSQVVTTEVAKAITLTGYDSAGDALTYAIVTQPAHGTLTGTPPNVTYTPAANFYGTDRFTFKTNDGTSDSEPGTVSVIVGVAGTGLKGEYFNNANFTALKLTRTDPTVNFDWAYGSPNALIAPDSFSVRWSGQLLAPETAGYRFSTLNSDGVRLWVNGVQVLSDYSDHPIRWNDGVSINLTAGRKYNLVMEYYENTGNAAAKLKWTGPSFAGANGVIIANKWLYDGSPITNRAPVAVAQSVTLAEDIATAITLGGGDPFFDALTYAIVTPPTHGTLSGTAPNLTYTPAANYNGADSFTFTVNDGTITSAAATVGLTITPVNDATLANAAATYAGYTATTATLNATLTCDEATYSVYAYWGTTNGGSTAAQWQNSAFVGTRSNVTASALSQPVTGLTANTRYYFTFRAVNAAGELWAGNVLNFGPNPTGDLLTFGLPNQPAIISGTAVAWPVLSSAVVTSLAPTFTLSPGATCNKASGFSQNFSNPVTYTVTAQDGTSKIYTVTVTQQPNATFTWNSTSSGNWSLASKWLNESGAAVAPATGGQTYYTLNFTNTGTYTATHDLGTGFLLNRLNFSGPTATIAGTNSLAFSQWNSPYGVIAPQVNQNGSSAITISAPISLASSLTFGGTGTGQITLTGVVGAASLNDGSLIQTGANVLYLNNANNGYPGGLTVSNSTLKATVGTGKALGGQNGNWQGTRMKLTNATLQLVNGGWCSAGFELLGTNTITQTDATYTFFLGGLTGSGLLNLTGNNSIAFNGSSSTYSGDVRINQGASAYVNCGGTDALGSGGTVFMASAGGVKMGIESSNGASLDNYIQLDTDLILPWTYNTMTFNFKRNISGPGSLTKVYGTADAGTHLQLRGLNSTYSGGTIFKSGNLEVLGGSSLGTGPVTLGGKATTVPTHVMTFVNLAPMTIANNFVLAGISEPSLTDLAAVTTFTVNQDLELAGNVSGTGGLLKIGSQTLTLSGINTCSGLVKVQAGVLACTHAASLGQGALDITAGAKVQLDYEGTRQIAALTFNGGAAQPNGTYGSSSSLATNKDDSHFTGTGMVTIGPVAAANTVTTLALTSGANPSASGTLLTFTATVAGNAPTGTVTFYCGGAVIGTGVLNGSFQASATTSSLPQGWQYVTAVYQGDTNNLLDISETFEQFVGEPLPNVAPVATAQSVSTAEDTAKAITLAGTDADGDGLTYVIITAPAHGTLTGTAPSLTYTPAANYNGSDSFTFRVNDGHVSSAVAAVSLTVTAASDAPVAYAQSVSVGINSAKAITLVATDADGGTLTYTIVTSPTHGSLSGTAPNVTYTPTTNYSGADSFTFRASDGTNTSATVTVSITVTASVFTWNSAVAGNWSDSSKWAAGSGNPAAAGQLDYVLDFTKSGTYTATHDLNAGFLLNQMSFAGAVTLAGTNSMALSANGGAQPQLNQNSASSVSISTPVALASNVTLGGSGSGNLSLSGVISGTGSLTKNNTGTLTLSGVNTYSGGTTINAGSINLANTANTYFGTGPVTVNSGATLNLNGNGNLTNAFTLNAATLFNGNSFSAALNGPVTMTATSIFDLTSTGQMSIGGNISGPGGLTKKGTSNGPLNVSGANSFTGAVTVQAGILRVASLNSVSGGTATSNLGAPTTVADGTISLGATTTTGTVLYIGTGETTDRIINLAGTTGGATLDQSGASGLLTITSSLAVTGVGAKILTLQGSTAGSGVFTGAIVNSSSGATALTKSGTGTWTLSGVNSYTGATKVTAGTLTCSIATSLGGGTLDITSGAKLNLDYVGTRQVAALTFNTGSAQLNGSYGSSSSSAAFKDDTYFAGTGTVTVGPLVGGTTTTLTLTGGSSPSNIGAPLTFTATVAGSTPTGNVTFYVGASFIGTSALNGSFQASVTTSSLATGSYNITAQYAGDENNASSTSAVVAVQVGPPTAPTNLVATPSSNTVSLTWTASSGATSYNVKRSLTNGGSYSALGTASGTSYTDATAVNGTTYYYVVSAVNGPGESVNSAQVTATPFALPSTTTLTSSLGASGVYGSAVTFTATVAVTGGPATGTVTFKDGVTVLGTGALSAGTTTFAISTLAAGAHSITATYGGDSTFATSISSAFAYSVSAKPVTISGVTASDKIYDATTTATLTGGTLSSVVSGETVTVVAGTGAFANANVGTWAVTAANYGLGGANAGNYTLTAQPTVPNASITARTVVLTGTRVYDGTLAASGLSIANNVDGANLGVTGSTSLVGKDVGSQALIFGDATPVRVRSATGTTGTTAAITFSVTMGGAPVSGNTMVAVISTRGTSANRVTSIAQTGATWSRVTQATNTSGTTTEIWVASNVAAGAGTAITITQASLLSAAVVMEYSGVLAASPVDQTISSTGTNTAAVTGTIASTAQASELWLGGIGIADGRRTLNAPYGNSFTVVASPQSSNTGTDAMIYALEKIVSASGSASSSGTLSASDSWAGALATFKAASISTLALTGSAAGNYTLIGVSGAMTITQKPLTVSGLTASAKAYNGTSAETLSGTAALLTAETAGAGTTSDGKPYTGDTLTLGGTVAGTFADPNVGTAKVVTVTGVTLTGASSGNYTLTQPTGLTADITARSLTVTASNQSKTYGQTVTFGSGGTQFTSSGLQNGETIGSVTLACTGGSAAAVAASYSLTPSAATGGTFAASNYTLQYVAGTFTVNVASTGTSVASSLNPATVGTSVTFTATVTGGIPTGNVAFYAGATLLGTSALNGSFQATFSTSSLAVGSYNITAQYAGDTNNGASTSTALSQVIVLPAPPANLVATPGSNTVGLTWTASSGATGYNVKRSLTNGGSYTALGSTSGTSYTDTTAVNGTTYYYVVSATNGANEGANSTQVSATPIPTPSTTTLASSLGASGAYGSAVTFTATVAVTGGPATGTVTFKDGATVLGTGALGSGTATFATSTLAMGAHSITATYGGDTTFATSVSSAFAYAVTAKPVTITGVTAGNKVYDNTTTATLSGGTVSGVVSGETVTVTAGTGTFASANAGIRAVTAAGYALGGADVGNYTLSAQPTVPNATITARPVLMTGTRVYDGTAAAAAGILLVSNNLDAGNLTLTGSVNLAGKDVGFTSTAADTSTLALAGSAAGNYTLTGATGTVQITPKTLGISLAASARAYDGTSVATFSGPAALLATEAAGAGTTNDGKPYTGDAVALGGTAAGTFADPNVGTAKAVTVTGVTLTGTDSGNYTITQPAGLTADITARSLTVTASNQSKTYGQTVTFGSGSTQFTSSGLQNGETIGSVTLACTGGSAAAAVASYSLTPSAATGGTFAASNYTLQYVAGTFTVNMASTGTIVASSLNPATAGTSVTFTATVTGGIPTGNVAFYAGATLLGTSALNGSFQATFSTSSLAAGSYNITAQYAGDTNNGASTSTALSQVIVLPAPPTNLAATPGSNTVGLTWTASSVATGYNVKRSLTSGGSYTVLGSTSGTSYTDTPAANGTTYYYVVSATNGASEGANSSQVSATPVALPSTTTLASSLGASGAYGSAVTFTATVAVTGGPATGTVTFKDGATVLGTGTLGAGTATFAISTLALGAHSITATYGGDATFATSVSSAFAYSVTAKPVTITGVTAGSKVYDNTTTATLSGGAVSGVVSGETVTVVAGTGTFASANAGTWAVTAAGYALGGADVGNYTLSAQPTVPNATITGRPVQLTGARGYDGTAAAAAGILSISNNLDTGNLTLTGSANLTGKDVGSRAVITSTAGAARVQSAKGNTGASAAATISVTMGTAPVAGNTLVAVISTRGTSANIVTSITQTGVTNGTWVRAAQANNTSMTTEIWYAPNVPSGAGTAVTINQTAFLSAAVVMEYSGVLVASTLDQIAPGNSVGTSTAAVTGTTTTTSQANELWIGGIGFADSTPTLGTILNSFTSVDNAASTNATTGSNARVYALERMVSSTGAASSGGTISASAQWAGTIATFKAATSTLALAGSAAGNYTLTGATGTVQITTKTLGISLTASARAYDGTSVATFSGPAALLTAEAAGAGTTSDGKPYTGDAVALGGTAAGTFADPNVGTAKAVTVTGVTLTGAGSGNYTITQPAGLTADITARSLTVTASNQSKTYGQTVTFGSGSTQFTSSGLQNGETIGTVTLACTGGGAAAVAATYPLTPSAATGGTFTASNYTLQYVAGTFTVNVASTGTAVASSLNPADLGVSVTFTATVTGGTPTGNVTFYDGATALGTSALNGSFQATFGSSSLAGGTHSISAQYAGNANYAASTATALSQVIVLPPFDAWASDPAQGLTAGVNNGPMDDPDRDGISNLMEFALGGAPMVSSRTILPTLTRSGNNWLFDYNRSDLSLSPATTQVVEYGSDLAGWTTVTIPTTSAGIVTITPGSPSDHVTVTIASPGAKCFVRLKVTK